MNRDHNQSGKTIALIDWTWLGHHPSYYILFVKALLELGHRIVALCPDGGAEEVVANQFMSECHSRMLTIQPFQRITSVPRFLPGRFLPPHLYELVCQFRTFRVIDRMLWKWEHANDARIDLVFFACMYDVHFSDFQLAWRFNPRPWSGLYLHCRAFRKPGTVIPGTNSLPSPERFLRAKGHRALAILDEGVTDKVTAISARPTVVFPDVTDESVSEDRSELAKKIKFYSQGRPIVGLLGYLQHGKGCMQLAKLAEQEALQDVMFAFVGEAAWGSFSEQDARRLGELQESLPNVFTHFYRVRDDSAFNGICQTCDILYAAYLDFPHSSNILTKAAVFEKPVIVSDGSLMAERTREYRLGEVVPENDLAAAEHALIKMTRNLPHWIARNQPRWAEYRKRHSFAALKESFRQLLAVADI